MTTSDLQMLVTTKLDVYKKLTFSSFLLGGLQTIAAVMYSMQASIAPTIFCWKSGTSLECTTEISKKLKNFILIE